MNAKASGMPPKFAATPENVVRSSGPRGRPLADRGVGDEEPGDAADQRRDEADLDARLVRVDVRVVEEQPDVRERPVVVLVLERADEHRSAGTNRNTIV